MLRKLTVAAVLTILAGAPVAWGADLSAHRATNGECDAAAPSNSPSDEPVANPENQDVFDPGAWGIFDPGGWGIFDPGGWGVFDSGR